MSISIGTPAFGAARERLAGRFAAAQLDPWWSALPALLDECAATWDLVLGEPVGHGETAVVVPVTRGASPN